MDIGNPDMAKGPLGSTRIPLQTIAPHWLSGTGVALSVLRADLVDPLLSGNKYFKLKLNLEAARLSGHNTLLSFGGPWSNHLHALAAAGQRFGFNTIGVVRGEAPGALNACLQDARDWGMHLHFVSRSDYQRRDEPDFLAGLEQVFGEYHLIPEGGANLEGLLGCRELAEVIPPKTFSRLLLACGTGTTLAGLITAADVPVTGIQVLKGAGYLQGEVRGMLAKYDLSATAPWEVLDEFHGGGYARADPALLDFCNAFTRETGVPLEPVYSGKLFFAIANLLARGHFARGSNLLAIHGGGLQGLRGFGMSR